MYHVFNMGIGMMVVVKPKASDGIVRHLRRYVPAFVIGEIIKSKQAMELV